MLSKRTTLASATDIPDWLEQDRQLSWEDRVERDRAIDQRLEGNSRQNTDRVLAWWSEVEPKGDVHSSGEILAKIFSRVSGLSIIMGLLAGVILASSLLRYDGSQPINVLVLLVVLIVLPIVLFLLSLLIPIFSSSSLFNDLNIGKMLFTYIKQKSVVLSSFFSSSRSDQAKDVLLRWKLLLCSQQFGIALAIAALLTLLVKLSISDLAFGWSTTLDIKASVLSPWIQTLAAPWSIWFPEAVPSQQLIEDSRFFRLENGVSELSATTLTGWWKFIAMCLLVYGVGFRLLAGMVANRKYNKSIESLLMQHSEIEALLDRFNVENNTKNAAPVVSAKQSAVNHSNQLVLKTADLMISWNDVLPQERVKEYANCIEITSEDILNLRGKLLEKFSKNRVNTIHVITKSWEPPLLEFHDLILSLREIYGSETTISIQPISATQTNPESVDVEIWRHSLEKLQDSKVYIV